MDELNVVRLGAEDFDEAMDFLNLIFSQTSVPHDFANLIPGLYKPTNASMSCNYAIRRNGRIRSVVGLFPVELSLGGRMLKAGGIGGVATHPNERNSGMMRRIMETCINSMKEQGYHFSCLGGQRQRYNYYGYEKAGTATRYTVSVRNVKHYSKSHNLAAISFEKLLPHEADRIEYAKKLYDREPVHINRPLENFHNYLRTWNMQPWSIIDEKGNMIGYLVADKTGARINEIFTEDIELFDDAVCAWVQQYSESTLFYIPFWSVKLQEIISSFAESTSIQEAYMWQIFRWAEVIEALLAFKSSYTVLTDGEIKFGIKGYGTINIIVKSNAVTCNLTDEEPDFTLEQPAATRVIIGPQPAFISQNVPSKLHPVLASWFPLPLCWFQQDNV